MAAILCRESGFYYLQSRYYDPQIGRFINADELLQTSLNTGLNLFAYCENDPVNNTDRNGGFAVSAFLGTVLAGAIIGAAFSAINAYIAGEEITFKKIAIGAAVGATCAALTAFAAFPSTYAAGILATSTSTAKTVLSMGSVVLNSMLAFAASDSMSNSSQENVMAAFSAGVSTFAGLFIPEVSFSFNLLTSLAVCGTVELSATSWRLLSGVDSSYLATRGAKGNSNAGIKTRAKYNNAQLLHGRNKMTAYAMVA